MRKFIVDTNFFIQAHRSTYPFDVVPSFWHKVKHLSESGVIISIDKVKKEIFSLPSRKDQLKKWCESNLPPDFFLNTEDVSESYASIAKWARSRSGHYTSKAIDDFLEVDKADPWLVAFASTVREQYALVTYEVSEPNRRHKIKIPEACTHFQVACVNPIEMFRHLGKTF